MEVPPVVPQALLARRAALCTIGFLSLQVPRLSIPFLNLAMQLCFLPALTKGAVVVLMYLKHEHTSYTR